MLYMLVSCRLEMDGVLDFVWLDVESTQACRHLFDQLSFYLLYSAIAS